MMAILVSTLRVRTNATALLSSVTMLVACGDDTSDGGAAGGAGGDGGGDSSTSAGDGSTSGAGGSAECGTAVTHCSPAFHCVYQDVAFFSCAEYSAADAASYETICNDA